jgi:hypothetical protein
MRRFFVGLFGVALGLSSAVARADPAIVGVPGPPDRGEGREDDRPLERAEDPRTVCASCGDRPEPSVVRVALGGAAGAMDRQGSRGLAGLDLGLEVGRSVIGARFGATWLRAGDASAPGLAQYGAEVTVDMVPRGPFHPMAAVGLALAHTGGADAGVGTARIGIAYALPLREADVRVALSVLGALPGPSDADAAGLRGYAMGVASLGIGF